MNKYFTIIASMVLIACNNGNKAHTIQKSDQLLENISESNKIENDTFKEEAESQIPKKIDFDANIEVMRNLVHCENEKLIIRVDRMDDNILRYSSWSKPKSENTPPDLQLRNPIIEKLGTGGGYIFTFENNGWSYIVEDRQMGETEAPMGRFLKILKNKELQSYTKMTDVK